MRKIDRILLYKIIAGVAFLVLCFTQLLHIRNMYNLESARYNREEKKAIQVAYERSITNDKLFPGGQKFIDSFVYRNYQRLEALWESDKTGYAALTKNIRDSLFIQLRAANNLDSLLPLLQQHHQITSDIKYALLFQSLEIAFQSGRYAPFFDRHKDPLPDSLTRGEGNGVLIGGSLKKISPENLLSGLVVSSPLARTYRIGFALHGESPDRLKQITLRLLPTILISLVSIFAVLLIFLVTLINWQRQRKVSEMKSDFINTITHEFQTPLTAIIIANKTIENENEALDNPRLSFLNGVIKRQAERMNVLVKQVAEASTDHSMVLNLERHSVNAVVEEILADYQVNIQEKSVRVSFEKTSGNDRVYFDKLHFTSIVLNILDNAIKYNHKAAKEIRIAITPANGKTLVLSIADNGDGMSERVRKHIFTRFYRDPSLTRSNEPGLGLGLYFTQQSLKAHGWKYDVKSKEGTGTEFRICLPLVPATNGPQLNAV